MPAQWGETLFDIPHHSFHQPLSQQPVKAPQRTRKVTISEIMEDNVEDDWTLISEEADARPDDLNTDEVFGLLDDLVQSWKNRLESILGESLKALRKNGREKKLMAKYIPGEGSARGKCLLEEAKMAVLEAWKTDFDKIMRQTSGQLETLTNGKVKEAEGLMKEKIAPLRHEAINRNKKDMVNLEFKAMESHVQQYQDLQLLATELGKLCGFANQPDLPNFCLPPNFDNFSAMDHTLKTDTKYLRLKPNPSIVGLKQILADFTVKNYKRAEKERPVRTKKTERRSTPAQSAQRKMLERKQKKMDARFKLLHVKKSGQDRFFIVRKREKLGGVEAEEIFGEWISNLEAPVEVKRKPRVRKLSNRYKRKEIIREAARDSIKNRTFSYADIVRNQVTRIKGTEEAAEDIFQTWRTNLDQQEPKAQKDTPISIDALDIFKAWRHNLRAERFEKKARKPKSESAEVILSTAKAFQRELQECGMPTIPVVKKPAVIKQETTPQKQATKTKPGKHLEFGGKKTDALNGKNGDFGECEIFNQWSHNLAQKVEEEPTIAPKSHQKTKKNRKQQHQLQQQQQQEQHRQKAKLESCFDEDPDIMKSLLELEEDHPAVEKVKEEPLPKLDSPISKKPRRNSKKSPKNMALREELDVCMEREEENLPTTQKPKNKRRNKTKKS